jgi:hypothetical protein
MFLVLNDFVEKFHKNTVYRKGDSYPHEGFEADSTRVEFLQEVHQEYGVPFLAKPVEVSVLEKVEPPQPKKTTTKRTPKSGDK